MTELRRRMDNDMVLRGMAPKTREAYLGAVTGLARYYRRPPDQISADEVQAYLLELLQVKCASALPAPDTVRPVIWIPSTASMASPRKAGDA